MKKSIFITYQNHLSAVFMAIFAFLSGCTPLLPTVPSFDTDGQFRTGKIVWHDLVTPDMKGAQTFYAELFGWSFQEVNGDYTLIQHQGANIGGIAEHNRTGDSAYWVPLVSVPDINDAVQYTAQTEGTVLLEPFHLPGRGEIAVLKDPQGAIFGLLHARAGDPVERKKKMNEWLWHEIWAYDPESLIGFYSGLIGYRVGEKFIDKHIYRFLEYNDTPRVGLVKKQNTEVQNTWVAYIRVADVAETVAQVKKLGGQILMPPTPKIRNGTVAIITDPSGAGLVIQEWNK